MPVQNRFVAVHEIRRLFPVGSFGTWPRTCLRFRSRSSPASTATPSTDRWAAGVNEWPSRTIRGNHINDIKGFWGHTKTRLARFRGVHAQTFFLHLKELEFRFTTAVRTCTKPCLPSAGTTRSVSHDPNICAGASSKNLRFRKYANAASDSLNSMGKKRRGR